MLPIAFIGLLTGIVAVSALGIWSARRAAHSRDRAKSLNDVRQTAERLQQTRGLASLRTLPVHECSLRRFGEKPMAV